MKKERGVIILVSPEFHKKVKVEAAQNGYTMIEFTRKLSKRKSLLQDFEDSNLSNVDRNTLKGGFHFKI